VGQTLKDIEIICVNDGSTDGSRAILERYAQTDLRITIVDKENGGVSSARNAGLDVASGEYIIFLDSDDLWEHELLDICCEKADASSVDIVFFDAQSFFESDDLKTSFAVYDGLYIRKGNYEGIYDGLSLFSKLRAHDDYRESACLLLYRKDFLDKRGLRFMEGTIHEDDVFTFSALLGANRVQHIPQALYHRRVRGDSIVTASKGFESFWGKYRGQIALTSFLAENHINLTVNPAVADYLEKRYQYALALFSASWETSTNTEAAEFFDKMAVEFGAIETIAILAQQFWNDRRKVATKLGDSETLRCTRDTVRTIAMFYHRLHNGGVEKVMVYLTDLLSAMGYKVVLFTNQEPSSDDYITAHSYDRVTLPTPGQGIEYHTRAECLLDALKIYGVDLFIYHAWLYAPGFWDALVIKSLGIPFLMYTHGSWASKILDTGSTYRFEMPAVYALFDGVVSLTRCDRLYWSCFNPNAHLVYNPEFSVPSVPDERVLASDELVWVGRLTPEKNYEDLLGIMELIVRERPQAHLTIVGKGESDEIDRHFQETIDERGLSKAITLTGYHHEVTPYYHNAAVFLLTSQYEGFSYTLLESKSHALPCVAYDLPYLELFREGKGIIAVPPGDIAQMAKRVVCLLNDRALLRKMSEDAQESFLSYRQRDMATSWQEIIDSSVSPTTGGYHLLDPDANETLRLIFKTELFFAELALQKACDEGYQAAAQKTHTQLQKVLNSKSFRIGNALMIIPRKVRAFFTRKSS
jgi:glycosyltransferase involved in cell wall biosynthesis